jgi:hypothetical protein
MKSRAVKFWTCLILAAGLDLFPVAVVGQDEHDPLDGSDSPSPELMEELESLRECPVEVNRADETELLRIPGLTVETAKRIVTERKSNGAFHYPDDLMNRLGLDVNQLARILPYIRFDNTGPELFSRTREIRRTAGEDGETSVRFDQKVRARSGPVLGEIVLQDRTGEKQILRGFSEVKKKTWDAVVGNFCMEAGQGLVFWSPYYWTKGSDPVAPALKEGRGAKGCAYPSAAPMLGGAASIRYDGVGLDLMAGNTSDKIPIAGGRLGFSWGDGEIGISGWRDKTGSNVAGSDGRFARRPYEAAWEIARSRSGGVGFVGICRAGLAGLDWVAAVRRFDPDFESPFGQTFTGRTQNEKGFYWGVSATPFRRTRIGAFYDVRQSMGPDRTHPAPFGGDDAFIEWDQRVRSGLGWTFRFRIRREDILEEIPGVRIPIEVMIRRRHQLCRLELRINPTRWLKLKSRFETARVEYGIPESKPVGKPKTGFVVLQDLRIDADNLALLIRFAAYESDDWDSRVYELENDLPGVLTLKAMSGRGLRGYGLLKCRIGRWADLSVKYAETADSETNSKDREFGMGMDLRWPGRRE